MASRLREFPKDKVAQVKQYPWDRWFDGSVWKITKNSDFDEDFGDFVLRVYSEGNERALLIRLKIQDLSVIVQAFTIDQVQNVAPVSVQRKNKHKARVRLNEEEVKELKKMKGMGYSNAEVAKHFGISESSVYNKTRVA